MNYDLDTPEGMTNAVQWNNKQLARVTDGGIWIVPRSGLIVRVVDGMRKVASIREGHTPDPSVRRVMVAAGWTVQDAE